MAKSRTVIITPEQEKANKLWRVREGLKFCPEPTYRFNIGTSVSIGNLQDCIISDILDDGKVYEIDYTDINHNYGNPIIKEHRIGYWLWYEIRPYRNNISNHNIIKNKDMQLHYSQRNLSGILCLIYYFGTNLDPSYQRGYVWDNNDKISLIHSIFNNIDIGKFVFSYEEYNDSFLYEVIDGKQRINAICEYYENKFSYNGLYFNDLSKIEQYHFTGYPVSYAELRDMNEEQKIRYFVRLNKFGKIMDKEHLSKIEKMLGE